MKPIDAPKPRTKSPAGDPLLSAAAAELARSLHVADPRNLKPGELLRTLNSTPLGTVLSEQQLRAHRSRAGLRISDREGKRLDLLRYTAWLVAERANQAASKSAPPTLRQLADGAQVSERTLNSWIARGCPRTSLDAVLAWHAENVLPRQGGPRKDRDTISDRGQQALQQRVNEANAEKAEQDARLKQIKADHLERRLVPIDQVVREAAELFTEVRAVLDSIPSAVTKEVPQQLRSRIYEIERNKIDAALRVLAAIHLLGSNPDGA